jgi:ribosomal protein S24E
MLRFYKDFLNFLSNTIKVYMKYPKDFGYMSIIETITDVNNSFLSRRELTCNFAGLGGKLKKLEAIDMVTKEFKLDGKVVISMRLKTDVGRSHVTGTFFIYDDEALAKKHINPTIFSRLERANKKLAEAETAAQEKSAEEKPAEDKEVKAEDNEVKAEDKEKEKSE